VRPTQKESVGKLAAYIDREARQHAAFSRLPRSQREAAFEVVRARKGPLAVVKVTEMIEAHLELTGGCL